MFEIDEIDRLFTPQQYRRFEDIVKRQGRLVHYTSAEAAFLILSSKSIWLRNTMFMNDFSEIEYALDLIGEYWSSKKPERAAFWSVIDRTTGGRAKEVQDIFDGWAPDLSTGTFVVRCRSICRAKIDSGDFRCGAPTENQMAWQ